MKETIIKEIDRRMDLLTQGSALPLQNGELIHGAVLLELQGLKNWIRDQEGDR